jgi:hypothetical protein
MPFRFPLRRPSLATCVLLILAVSTAAPVMAQEPVVAPLLFRLEGVGPIYGLAGGVRGLSGEHADLYAAATAGSVEGQALLLTGVPAGAPGLSLTFFAVRAERAELITSYTRGTAPDRPVRQELSGLGWGGVLSAGSAEEGPQFSAGFARTAVSFEGFETPGGRAIPLPNANLADVETNHLSLSLGWRRLDSKTRPTRGLALGAALWGQTGRLGQSDVLDQSLRGTGYVPLGSAVTWAVHLESHDVRVLKAASNYDTAEEVAPALEAECASVADPAARARCEALATDIAAYIAESNRVGTAAPLGGSTSLRAYRESRFRAAHTRLAATELRIRHTAWLEWVLFAERGFAADSNGGLYGDPQDSAGLGARIWIAEIPVRLEAADCNEGMAWFLTAGMPW